MASTHLEGNGDFRSAECIELLKQADIVVTNPPFSLFREYVAQLVHYDKQFLIVGHQNAITYKEIFPLIRDNKLWLGLTPRGKDMLFDVPEDYANELVATKKEGSAYKVEDGVVKGRLGSANWYTNLDYSQRHEDLILYKKYSPEDYPKYDNYDAIEVSMGRGYSHGLGRSDGCAHYLFAQTQLGSIPDSEVQKRKRR